MADQVRLVAEPRDDLGKGPTRRLRKQGRVPGIMYGYEVEPTSVHVDALELYHTLHTEAGLNVLIRLEVAGETNLTVARDIQRHPVKGDLQHVDFIAVNRDVPISVEVPVHLLGEEDAGSDGGVINHILYTVPIMVKPLEVPNYFEYDISELEINDVVRVEDLTDQLPEGAEFDIEEWRTVLTVNPPISESELEALEEAAGQEQEEPELIGEEVEPSEEELAEDDEGDDED